MIVNHDPLRQERLALDLNPLRLIVFLRIGSIDTL
jgi:hypothetical protein